jgi:hypothetical protein
LANLEAGFTCVQVWAKGYALTESECIRVRRGEDVTGVVVTLVRGAVLHGIAVDDRGEPVSGAKVTLHRNRETSIPLLRGTSGRPAYLKDTRTGSEGRFVLRELTGMTYQVEVDHPDYAIVRRDNVVVEVAQEQETSPFVLDRAARVEGVAIAPNGQLQADSIVQLTTVGGTSRRTSTDGSGRFVFRRLSPGEYQLACFGKTMNLSEVLRAAMNPPEKFLVEAGRTITRNVIKPD